MSDRLIDLEKKIQDSLEKTIESLDERLSALEEISGIATGKPVETHDFVWAMDQLQHGALVTCLADGVTYAKRGVPGVARRYIKFSSKIVDGSWISATNSKVCSTNPMLTTGSFVWAMHQLKDGKRIRRREWSLGIMWMRDAPVGLYLNYDIDANDWEIFYEPHNIQWAAEQLQDGKIVKRRSWSEYRLYPHGKLIVSPEDLRADDWELTEDD